MSVILLYEVLIVENIIREISPEISQFLLHPVTSLEILLDYNKQCSFSPTSGTLVHHCMDTCCWPGYSNSQFTSTHWFKILQQKNPFLPVPTSLLVVPTLGAPLSLAKYYCIFIRFSLGPCHLWNT